MAQYFFKIRGAEVGHNHEIGVPLTAPRFRSSTEF